METLCDVEVMAGGFAAVLTPEDFGELSADARGCAELQGLLDKHAVLHVKPRAPFTREAVGKLAFGLGYPRDWADRRPKDAPPPADEFAFFADVEQSPILEPRPPREPSYIEGLHYDGVTAYSVLANIKSSPSAPMRFADMRAAWTRLPARLKARIEGRSALHAGMGTPRTPYADLPGFDQDSASRRPLAIRHFRTGDTLLHLPKNPASRIEGLDEAESRELLAELWDHVEALPGYACFPQDNEMLVWDGTAALHSNPAYPRDRARKVWFFTIPTRIPALDPAG